MKKSLVGRKLFGVELREGHELQDDITNLFSIDYDMDDELILKFNRTFENDFFDNGNPIKYNYYLNIIDMRDYDCDDSRPIVQLHLLPTVEFINKKLIDYIIKEYCPENFNPNNLTFKDIADETCPCILATEHLDFPDSWKWGEHTFDEIIETASEVIPTIDSVIGFYLDKHTNLIGTTNWDWLKDLLYDDYEALKETINRYHNN